MAASFARSRLELVRRYLRVDPRSLGLFRILLGVDLLLDLARRAPDVSLLYSNVGLVPNHTVLWRPPDSYLFSLFFTLSSPAEAAFGFALCAFCYAGLLIGYRTKLFQICGAIAVVSLHGRIPFLEDGGDVVMHLLVIWTLFLPLGARYSVDSWREEEKPETADAATSLAFLALLLQWSMIYLFNRIAKSGTTWREGTAVSYVLHQDRIVTSLGLAVRDHLPLWASRAMTRATLIIEGAAPFLILSPVATRTLRRVATVVLPLMHLGFALFLNLGLFSLTMSIYFALLLSAEDWQLIESWVSRGTAPWALRLRAVDRHLRDLCSRRGSPSPAILSSRLRRSVSIAREGAVGLLAIAAESEVLTNNQAIFGKVSWSPPSVLRALVVYPRMFQGWAMFSPDAPTGDEMVAIDATTASGRHVDPYNEALGIRVPVPVNTIPIGLHYGAIWDNYCSRIADNKAFHEPLKQWILRYPERTGNPEDRIVAFEARVIEDDSPAPGTTEPTRSRSRVFLRYPH